MTRILKFGGENGFLTLCETLVPAVNRSN